MTLLSSMTRNLGMTKRVSINEVRINRLNEAVYDDASDDIIAGLMNSILENGQMENAIAYESTVDFDGETDGCKYTLLGGNTRYLAIKKLHDEGKGDGYINISIVAKPEDKFSELEFLVKSNIQRKKTAEERYNEVLIIEKLYNRLENKPAGKKRDWIGKQLGISGRYVDKLINKFTEQVVLDEDLQEEDSSTEDNQLERQTDIYDYIDDPADSQIFNENSDVVVNANEALTKEDIVKMMKNNVNQIRKTVNAAREINLEGICYELEDILDEMQLLINNFIN